MEAKIFCCSCPMMQKSGIFEFAAEQTIICNRKPEL